MLVIPRLLKQGFCRVESPAQQTGRRTLGSISKLAWHTLLSLDSVLPATQPTLVADCESPLHSLLVPHLPQSPPASADQACICNADMRISP